MIQAGAGLNLSWPGASGTVALDTAALLAHADSFEITAQSTTRGIRQQLRDGGQVIGTFGLNTPSAITLSRNNQPAAETRLQATVSVELAPRRPVTADTGSPVHVSAGSADFQLTEAHGAVQLTVQTQPKSYRTALALSNALLTVEGPNVVVFQCGLSADGESAGGQFFCTFTLRGTLPILADPYTANFEPKPTPGINAQVVTGASWAGNEEPAVFIELNNLDNRAQALLSSMPQPLEDGLDFPATTVPAARWRAVSAGSRHRTGCWTSLPIRGSSVAFGSRGDMSRYAIENGKLQWYGHSDTLVFSVPSIQWEPVADSSGLMLSVDDGGPSAFAVDTVKLVPVAPLEAAQGLVDAYRAGGFWQAAVSLPFGIRAVITSGDPNPAVPLPQFPPKITLEAPAIAEFQSAPRLRFESTTNFGMPGHATQTDNVFRPGLNTNVLAFSAQGGVADVVGTMFNQSFQFNVPLHLYDWSGFGASAFSHWINVNQTPPSVSQVRFDVLNGRTSHEVIQVSAILWPCQAFLVRTITMERQNNASVVRHDSGWIASSDGRFTYAAVPIARSIAAWSAGTPTFARSAILHAWSPSARLSSSKYSSMPTWKWKG